MNASMTVGMKMKGSVTSAGARSWMRTVNVLAFRMLREIVVYSPVQHLFDDLEAGHVEAHEVMLGGGVSLRSPTVLLRWVPREMAPSLEEIRQKVSLSERPRCA